MDPISCLPDGKIVDKGRMSKKFLSLNITSFTEACEYIKNMPYGYTASSDDGYILFTENMGTCEEKHSVAAELAFELDIPVVKKIGVYKLNDEIVTGVSNILSQYSISYMPQSHCFLTYGEFRVDLTEGNCNGKNKTIEDYIDIHDVSYKATGDEKNALWEKSVANVLKNDAAFSNMTLEKVKSIKSELNELMQSKCNCLI
ncbi:hypothetical protein ACFL20_12850 [Spirochaetota bacterium]